MVTKEEAAAMTKLLKSYINQNAYGQSVTFTEFMKQYTTTEKQREAIIKEGRKGLAENEDMALSCFLAADSALSLRDDHKAYAEFYNGFRFIREPQHSQAGGSAPATSSRRPVGAPEINPHIMVTPASPVPAAAYATYAGLQPVVGGAHASAQQQHSSSAYDNRSSRAGRNVTPQAPNARHS